MANYRFPERERAEVDLTLLLRRSIDQLRKENLMKDTIEVSSRAEGEAVRKALENPVTKAIVVVEGVLAELTDAQAERVLAFVKESRNGGE